MWFLLCTLCPQPCAARSMRNLIPVVHTMRQPSARCPGSHCQHRSLTDAFKRPRSPPREAAHFSYSSKRPIQIMAFRHSLNLPPARPSSGPPQFAFQPQRVPFKPPSLRQEESSGSAFLADLSDVPIPPVASAAPRFNHNAHDDQVQCSVCSVDLTGRPRVHCLECARYDVCSACHTFREIGRGHRREHHQQTFKPVGYPRKHRRPYREDGVVYQCDACQKELTNEPRARCAECKN